MFQRMKTASVSTYPNNGITALQRSLCYGKNPTRGTQWPLVLAWVTFGSD